MDSDAADPIRSAAAVILPQGCPKALYEMAVHHCRHRRVFQKTLIDQPLMATALADMALDVEAATTLAFRLAHLGGGERARRLAGVLERVGEMAGWGAPPPSGRGRGVAAVDDYGTVVAAVAEARRKPIYF